MDFFNNLVLSSQNLKSNLKTIKKTAGSKKICAMVKANAYGHDLKFAVLNLKNDVDFFGVANACEALEVRKYAKKTKILVCGKVQKTQIKSMLENNISLSAFSLKSLQEILSVCKKENLKANVHIKLNTGMNRMGIKSKSNFLKALKLIHKNKNFVVLEGIYSHLFCAENSGLSHTQYHRFLSFLNCINIYNKSYNNFIMQNKRGVQNNNFTNEHNLTFNKNFTKQNIINIQNNNCINQNQINIQNNNFTNGIDRNCQASKIHQKNKQKNKQKNGNIIHKHTCKLLNNYAKQPLFEPPIAYNFNNILIHLENSAGLFNGADYLNICSMARIGIALYGLEIKNKGLKPVLSLCSEIVQIQCVKCEDYCGYGKTVIENDGKVAVVPIGYADGIIRAYKNHFVEINNSFCKILNVCMDSILVDISKIDAKIGDKVTIISNKIYTKTSANNIAKRLNTISYEVVTNLNHNRLNKIFE